MALAFGRQPFIMEEEKGDIPMKYIKEGKERTKEDRRELRNTVSAIIEDVVNEGDAALKKYSGKFDGFVRDAFRVSREEIQAAYDQVPAQDIEDMKAALHNLRAFAEAQRATIKELPDFEPMPGIHLDTGYCRSSPACATCREAGSLCILRP